MKAKLLTAAALSLAGLGFACQKPVASTPAPTTPVVDIQPVVEQPQTPLVEKLVPKKPAPPKGTEHLVGDKAFFVDRNGLLYIDGATTKSGLFKYEAARNIYVPVDFGNVWHSHNKRRPTAEHLIATHGHAPSSVAKWTQREIEICHANDHAAEYAAKQAATAAYSLSCPNGQCGNPSYGRGLFGRRR